MEFKDLLKGLMSSDNVVRKAAEAHFEGSVQQSPAGILENLLAVLYQPDENVWLKPFAAVLTRRIIEKYLTQFPPMLVEEIRNKVVTIWSQEQQASNLTNKLAHILAQIMTVAPAPMFLEQIVKASFNISQTRVLYFIEIVAEYCPEDVTAIYTVLGEYFTQAFASTTSAEVKLSCSRAASACVAVFVEDKAVKAFQPVLMPMLQTLGEILAQGDENDATILLDRLIEVAQFRPVFFKNSFENVLQAMMMIGKHQNLEFSTRAAAMELLVTLCESAPAMARRCTNFIPQVVKLIMQLMLQVDVDSQKSFQKSRYTAEEGDTAGDDDFLVAEESLERLASALGGKSVCELVLGHVQSFSQAKNDWRQRRAALAAISRLAEGCTEYFEKYLPALIPYLQQSIQQETVDVRVQYEAIQVVGRLAATIPSKCTQLVHDFLACLATILQQHNVYCDQVRGHAANALINLLNPEHCDGEILETQGLLDPLLNSLLLTLQSSRNEIRAPCLTVIGYVAQLCPETFAPYYEKIMPGVKEILLHAQGKDLVLLRGKAMECAGLIGEVVGISKFASDAYEIMKMFLHIMMMEQQSSQKGGNQTTSNHNHSDDISFEYILPACARMAKALGGGKDFNEFLPSIMTVLLQGANQETQFSLEQVSSSEEEGGSNRDGEVTIDEEAGTESTVMTLAAGMKMKLTVNTHAAQQKEQAGRLIYEFTSYLGYHMGLEYIMPCLQTVMKLLQEKYSPADIRISAAQALAKLLDSLLEGLEQGAFTPTMFSSAGTTANMSLEMIYANVLQVLMTVFKHEHDENARNALAEASRDILQSLFEHGNEESDGCRLQNSFPVMISDELSMIIVSVTLVQTAESMLRRNELSESIEKQASATASSSANGGDDAVLDEEDRQGVEEQMEQEDDFLGVLVDILGHLIKLRGEAFMPMFDKAIAPAFQTYLQPGQPPALQAVVTCLIDDAIEYGGPSGWKYLPTIAPLLMLNTQSNDFILAQSSMYGLAVAFKRAPTIMQQFLAPGLSCFVSMILNPQATAEEDFAGTIENAIFGLSTLIATQSYRELILKTYQKEFPLAELSKLWLKKLPLKLDGMEVKTTMMQLCDVLESWDVQVLSNDPTMVLPDILRIFSEVALVLTAQAGGKAGGMQSSPNSVAKMHDNEEVYANLKLLPVVTLQRMKTIVHRLLAVDEEGVSKAAKQVFAQLPTTTKAALQTAFK